MVRLQSQLLMADTEIIWLAHQAIDACLRSELENACPGHVQFFQAQSDVTPLLYQKHVGCLVCDLRGSNHDDAIWGILPTLFNMQCMGIVIISAEQKTQMESVALPARWLLQFEPVHAHALLQNIRFIHQVAKDTKQATVEPPFNGHSEHLANALLAAGMTTFDYDLSSMQRVEGLRQHDQFAKTPNSLQDTFNMVHPDDRLRAIAVIERSRKTGEYADAEYRVMGADGKYHWIKTMGRVVGQNEHSAGHMIGVSRDISDIKLLEREREKLQHSLEVALTGARLNHWRVDLDTQETFPGPLDEEFFGFVANSVDELVEVIHPEDLPTFRQFGNYEKIIRNGTHAAEYRVKRMQGDGWRWLSSFSRHVKQSSNEIGMIVGVTWDITQRKETEMALELANQKLLAAMSAAHMLYFEWDMKTGKRNVIGAEHDLLGTHIAHIGTARAMVHPDDLYEDEELIRLSFESGMPYKNQFRIILPNGGIKWLQSFATPLNDAEGKPDKLSGICFDVTDRMHLLEVLQDSEIKLKRAVSAGKLICWEWHPNIGLRCTVGAFEEILGIPAGEFTIDKFHGLVHPDDMSMYRKSLKVALDNKTDYHCEYRVIRPDGEVRWLLSNGTSINNKYGNVEYITGVAVDITARKSAEYELNESLNWLKLVVQAAGINTFSLDLRERTRKGGSRDIEMYGFSPTTIEQLERMIHPDDRQTAYDSIAHAVINKTSYKIRYRICRPDREDHWYETMGAPEYDERGRAIRVYGVSVDVHKQIQQTFALEAALLESEKATKSKSEFLANMSHEIRTPMNAVLGVSELLSKTNLSQQQKDWVKTLMQSSDQMLTLINEILDFSKLDADAMQLHPLDFSLSDCIESSLSLVASTAAAKGLGFSVSYPATIFQTVTADLTRIRQILVNLLSNAVKFTQTGSITVTAALSEPMDGEVQFEFRVKDSGIGMDNDTVMRLFKPFSQADSSFTRNFGGTGLGLSICKKLCTLMGGSISLNTQLGEGTEFILRLPLTQSQARHIEEDYAGLLQGKHVALIGMSESTAMNFRKQLAYFGAKTSVCRQASEINDQDCMSYDLVILPKQSVMMDNQTIAALLQNKPCILLQLFLTANQEQDFDAELDHEMLYYPYAPGQLLHAIKRSLALASELDGSQGPDEQHDAEQISALRILAVEDNEINQYVLQAMLESIGCKANIANDGLQAIQQLNNGEYDVVLMDIEMPNMDGMQATYAIRKNTSIQQPYIIALTAHVMSDSRTKFMQAGMDDYISKPILIAGLADALHRASSSIHGRKQA